MAYLMLVLESADRRDARAPGQGRAECEHMAAFADSLRARGVLLAAESLKSLRDGTRVEKRAGKAALRDGPFAEAKEIVGGFFLLDVADRAQALAIAAECPAAEWSALEVREVGPCYTE